MISHHSMNGKWIKTLPQLKKKKKKIQNDQRFSKYLNLQPLRCKQRSVNSKPHQIYKGATTQDLENKFCQTLVSFNLMDQDVQCWFLAQLFHYQSLLNLSPDFTVIIF